MAQRNGALSRTIGIRDRSKNPRLRNARENPRLTLPQTPFKIQVGVERFASLLIAAIRPSCSIGHNGLVATVRCAVHECPVRAGSRLHVQVQHPKLRAETGPSLQ